MVAHFYHHNARFMKLMNAVFCQTASVRFFSVHLFTNGVMLVGFQSG